MYVAIFPPTAGDVIAAQLVGHLAHECKCTSDLITVNSLFARDA